MHKIFARDWRAFEIVFTECSEGREEEKGKENFKGEGKRNEDGIARASDCSRGGSYPKQTSVLALLRGWLGNDGVACNSGYTGTFNDFDRF